MMNGVWPVGFSWTFSEANQIDTTRDHYENFPYPPRDPADEQHRLLTPALDCFDMLNHYGFGGARDFEDEFTVLVAGGGTGDSTIFLAEQLKSTSNKVVHVDISQQSIDVAKERAQVRGLTNIEWRQANLLNLNSSEIGTFDYINCTGVLHHLPDPSMGLASITSLLKDDGVLGLMVYGQYARTGVYQLQNLLRHLNKDADQEKKVSNAKSVLSQLPDTNWFKRGSELFGDHRLGDAGIYDLLLHEQDRAYTIAELIGLLGDHGLMLSKLVDSWLYDPGRYLQSEDLETQIATLDPTEQMSVAELVSGTLKTHTLYAHKNRCAEPEFGLDKVISLTLSNDTSIYSRFHRLIVENLREPKVSFSHENNSIDLEPSEALAAALKHTDGERSIAEILKRATMRGKAKRRDVLRALEAFYKTLNTYDMAFLRSSAVARYRTKKELHGA
ncbi:MAG: methyltransferase domain-containing protein [Pseudomonadales bacterium]|nr:methyltransferase domain-containing protein [Pseudomonadales bacterium]